MDHYAGIDVSLECSSVCVVDAVGKIVREGKVASEPEGLVTWFGSLGLRLERIGLEVGPLLQWLCAAYPPRIPSGGGLVPTPDRSKSLAIG